MSDWQSEFSDYPAGAMPDLPRDWQDTSWRNDSCPSFLVMQGAAGDSNFQLCRVWIDWPDPAQRDSPSNPRFIVTFEGEGLETETAFRSDNFPEVVAWIETRRFLAAAYAAQVGYNPFLDCPTIDPTQVLANLAWRLGQ